ncbi:MAG TPA: hypothetical protein VFD82_23215 [Planctomycetota bacterium]|nr:hypothetical protein [Planctomycetota bacterium]
MPPETYRLLHVVGALTLMIGLGGMLATAGRDGSKPPMLFMALHGIGLLTLLVAGIGVAHKSNLGWPNWMLAKIACWVLLAALPVLVRRGVLPRGVAALLVIGLGALAAWLALTKPF